MSRPVGPGEDGAGGASPLTGRPTCAPAPSPPGQREPPRHKPWTQTRPVGGGACGLTRGILSHEWVSPDFAAGDAGPMCSVLETASTPARTSTVLMATSTPVLLGKPWLLPVISDPGPRNRNGNTNPGRGPGAWNLPLGLLLHSSWRPRAPGARASQGQGLGARASSVGWCRGVSAECRSCGHPLTGWFRGDPGPAAAGRSLAQHPAKGRQATVRPWAASESAKAARGTCAVTL